MLAKFPRTLDHMKYLMRFVLAFILFVQLIGADWCLQPGAYGSLNWAQSNYYWGRMSGWEFIDCENECKDEIAKANKDGTYYAEIPEIDMTDAVPWRYDGRRDWADRSVNYEYWEDYRGCVFTYYPDVNWNNCNSNYNPPDIDNYLTIPSKDTEALCKEFAENHRYLKWDGSRNWKRGDGSKCGCIKWFNPEVCVHYI